MRLPLQFYFIYLFYFVLYCEPPFTTVYTIDGGHLRHRVVWQHPATYGQICEQCKHYTTKRCGCALAVFDGYVAPNTKDAEHPRRVASSREVLIEDVIQVSMPQQEFLGNNANKVRFIALLCVAILSPGITLQSFNWLMLLRRINM